jgi:hypothetical protein
MATVDDSSDGAGGNDIVTTLEVAVLGILQWWQ